MRIDGPIPWVDSGGKLISSSRSVTAIDFDRARQGAFRSGALEYEGHRADSPTASWAGLGPFPRQAAALVTETDIAILNVEDDDWSVWASIPRSGLIFPADQSTLLDFEGFPISPSGGFSLFGSTFIDPETPEQVHLSDGVLLLRSERAVLAIDFGADRMTVITSVGVSAVTRPFSDEKVEYAISFENPIGLLFRDMTVERSTDSLHVTLSVSDKVLQLTSRLLGSRRFSVSEVTDLPWQGYSTSGEWVAGVGPEGEVRAARMRRGLVEETEVLPVPAQSPKLVPGQGSLWLLTDRSVLRLRKQRWEVVQSAVGEETGYDSLFRTLPRGVRLVDLKFDAGLPVLLSEPPAWTGCPSHVYVMSEDFSAVGWHYVSKHRIRQLLVKPSPFKASVPAVQLGRSFSPAIGVSRS